MNKPNMQRIPDQRMISAIGYKDGTALQRGFPGGVPYSQFQDLIATKVIPKLTGNNSTFDGAGDWVTGLGSLTPDISTYPGNMYLNFTTGNQAVKIDNKIESGTKGYLLRIKCKIQSGTGTTMQIGSFAGTVNANYGVEIIPSTASKWYYGYLHSFATNSFYIGVVSANNNATKFLIEEIHIDECALADFYDLDISKQAIRNTTGAFSTLSKSAQALLQLNIMGDSILANADGAIPAANDEGATMRPPRLVTNNVIRQLYDDIKYGSPIHRRLDHADWVKSALSGSNDFPVQTDDYMWISVSGDTYYRSITANSYIEIVVPDGYANFALTYGSGNNKSGTDYDDAIAVTLNGGDISAYGNATINSKYTTLTPAATFDNGNTTVIYTGLPAGDNTIRFTKSNTTKIFAVHSGMYWNGNTIKINNHAVGGWDMDLFAQKFPSIFSTTLNTWIIEFPEMNNCSKSVTAINQVKYLCKLMNSNKFDINNAIFITIHPFGTDPSDGTPNYYTTYASPLTFKQRSTMDICLAVYFGLYFIDLFRLFEKNIIARGGTLAGGESGYYYTSDGQHLDTEGCVIFANYLLPKIPNIPN